MLYPQPKRFKMNFTDPNQALPTIIQISNAIVLGQIRVVRVGVGIIIGVNVAGPA